jgi:hypothetical protein
MMEKFFGEARRILVLGERVDAMGRDAQRALEMAIENRERIVRLETTMDIGMRLLEQRRAPQ